jgi:hypothetical protein
VKTCQEGKWNALILSRKDTESLAKELPETPQELTRKIGTLLLGENTVREAWEQ